MRRIEGPFSSLSLIAGFVFDAVTLTRVDEFWENFWVIGHLSIVTVCALLIHLIENEPGAEERPEKLHFWLVNMMQFFFGGIFSTFLVFYFRSGTLATELAVPPDPCRRVHRERIVQTALRATRVPDLALLPCLLRIRDLSPAAFFHAINNWIFLLSGIVALAAIGAPSRHPQKFLKGTLLQKDEVDKRHCHRGILVIVNTLYFENLIPPLPISLKDAGIYQSFTVNSPGNYTAQAEDQGWLSYFEWSPTIHVEPGTTLYAYTAIFSPASFNADIVHEWQYYDPTEKEWITRGRIVLPTAGGGSQGWRTFSEVGNVTAGAWRVNVELPTGQLVGQLRFNVAIVSSTPPLLTQNID